MKTVPKFISLALAVVVVAMGAVTANGALGDLFASVNGTFGGDNGSIYQYTPTGAKAPSFFLAPSLAGWPSTAPATFLWKPTPTLPTRPLM
jgi:hypothetical protein